MDPIDMQRLVSAFDAARASLNQGLPAAASRMGGLGGAGGLGAAGPAGRAGGPDFAQILKASLDHVDATQNEATGLARRFQLGDPKVGLEETMVAVQKANLEFQQVVQIRNRVVSAYHDIMSMQV